MAQNRVIPFLLAVGLIVLPAIPSLADDDSIARRTIERAVMRGTDYLSREVAGWQPEHHCYSCHNNGDGARALFAVRKMGLAARVSSQDAFVKWLTVPGQWDQNGPEGPFSDRKLARIQFAAALAQGVTSGVVTDRSLLVDCGVRLLPDQLPSGAWDFEGADAIGGPTTYGRVLATVLARQTLRAADSGRFAAAIQRTEDWLCERDARSVVDAAAVLRGLRDCHHRRAVDQRARCRELLIQAQSEQGGWGPYVHSGSEAFDTALAVWALASDVDDVSRRAVARGREYLTQLQLSDGSWPETTRPLPRESYSQRISTTAWAVLALVGD